jgi:EAL domain-containing protein (putative c-di-GMP-specific phosphodiesterase class I)
MSEDMGWSARIKSAIDKNQFVIACQPIVDAFTQNISRHEVLIRLPNDDGSGFILPAGFLPSAVRLGLMNDIDRWVVKHTITLLGQQSNQVPELNFSINLSAKSLEDKNMFPLIASQMDKNRVNPTQITFEITETDAIANMTNAVKFLNQLRNLGCTTALDDFGVGYSSFAYLKDLPVDYVKIDGSFVRNMQRDSLQLTMVRSMNDIAHALGKLTVAEYVDNRECMDQLKDIGVDYLQGFYVGEPQVLESVHTNAQQSVLSGITRAQ